MKRAAWTLIGALLSFSTLAQAEDGPAPRVRSSGRAKAEFGVGLLALPGATVCGARAEGQCGRGDVSPIVDTWQIFRATPRLSVGAGVMLAPFPTNDASRSDPPGIKRDHQRRYFTIEGTGRFHFSLIPTWENWAAATAGLVVVSDTYSSRALSTDRAWVGPRGVTTRSEGLSLGLGVGAVRALSDDWSLGLNLRGSLWLLPQVPARNPFGDEASLSGANYGLLIGVSVGYRLLL